MTLNVWFQGIAGLLALLAYAIEQGWLRPKEVWDRGLFWGFGLGLALFVAFRPWGVGTDDMAYSTAQFTEMTCPTLSCGSWLQGARDTAWYSLVGFLRSLDPSPRVQLFLVALGFLVKLWLIDRHVRHRCLSLLVYLALFFIIHELTALRLSLAIAVYLVALDALIRGRPLLGAFGLVLNGFFHKQAFVAPLVLLERWLDLTPLRSVLALLLPMGLLMMGLYPGDGLLHWLLAQPWGGEVARLVFGGESYLAGKLGGGYDQVRTWPVVAPPTVILAAWLIIDVRVLNRLHRVISASLILAVLFLWAYAVIPEVQLRFWHFFLVPIVWLIGQARLTPVKFWAIVFLALIYLIKYTVLHALLFDQTTLTLTELSGGQVAVDVSSIKVDERAYHLNRGARGSLRAVPAEGYRFKAWTKGCEGVEPLCPIEMQTDLEVGALFQKMAGLNLEVEGPGRILRGDQVACDKPTCSGLFDDAEALNFEAMPLGEALFIGWEGGCGSKDGLCDMKAGEALVLKARFKARHPVSFSVEGGGAVEIQDAKFGDCRTGCQRLIPEGSHLEIEAKPHEGLSFLGWEGACFGSDVICHLDVRAPLSARARFGHRLQLTMEGTGRFEGAGLPPECVGGCDRLLTTGTTLELNPVAAQGYRFIGWAGACQGPVPCKIDVQADLMLHATFLERPRFDLKLKVEAGGKIEDAAGALVCASGTIGGCRLKVSETTLIARPDEGFRFVGWQGCESQSEPRCTIWLERPRRLTAVFERRAVLMVLNEQGPGEIFWREGDLHCPSASSPCQVEVIPGTSITLEARPKEGHQFMGWRGACSDHAPTCSLSPGGPLGVSAHFE